jgi:surface protein
MFYNCNLLKSIPDITKWKIKKGTKMENIFKGCEQIEYLPEIS